MSNTHFISFYNSSFSKQKIKGTEKSFIVTPDYMFEAGDYMEIQIFGQKVVFIVQGITDSSLWTEANPITGESREHSLIIHIRLESFLNL